MSITEQSFTRTARLLACALVACAIAAPGGAVAAPVTVETRTDFRSPDTRDAAEGYAPELVVREAAQRTDFRSPDTRDAADGYAPKLDVTEQESAPSGFDWSSAGIGVAGAAGLFILALAMVSVVRLGRGRVARP
jgi:hypothetical protein